MKEKKQETHTKKAKKEMRRVKKEVRFNDLRPFPASPGRGVHMVVS